MALLGRWDGRVSEWSAVLCIALTRSAEDCCLQNAIRSFVCFSCQDAELQEGNWNWSWSRARAALPGTAVPQVSCPTLPFHIARLSFSSAASPVQHLYSECQRWPGGYVLAESAPEGLVRCHLKAGWRRGSPAVHDVQRKHYSYICPGCLLVVPAAPLAL